MTTFKPYSKYPPCPKDVSFWLPEKFYDNDMYEIVRDVAGDLVEEVSMSTTTFRLITEQTFCFYTCSFDAHCRVT